MDALKEALESVAEKLKGDLDKRQEELNALAPHFENAADALVYAKRLMTLKPGDIALLPDVENKAHMEGVFIGKTREGCEILPSFLIYDKEHKRLGIAVMSWIGVTLKD